MGEETEAERKVAAFESPDFVHGEKAENHHRKNNEEWQTFGKTFRVNGHLVQFPHHRGLLGVDVGQELLKIENSENQANDSESQREKMNVKTLNIVREITLAAFFLLMGQDGLKRLRIVKVKRFIEQRIKRNIQRLSEVADVFEFGLFLSCLPIGNGLS